MIEIRTGNIFDSKAECLVVPVNCYGIAGAGLAKDFDKKYVDFKPKYKQVCDLSILNIGTVPHIEVVDKDMPNKIRILALFPTKRHWMNDSRLEWIESGLNYYVYFSKVREYNSVAFPLLGAGLGKLDKKQVLSLMVKKLYQIENMSVEIWTL